MFVHAQTGHSFAALLINRAGRRMVRLRHFKQIIVRVRADQNARMLRTSYNTDKIAGRSEPASLPRITRYSQRRSTIS